MEGPPVARVILLGRGLTNVVEQGRPAKPQVVGALGKVVEHLHSVLEVILMGVLAATLDACHTVKLGEYVLE